MKFLNFLMFFIFTLSLSCSHLPQKSDWSINSEYKTYIQAQDVHFPRISAEAHGAHYGISTQGIYSTKAAKKILDQGGNLIDAFVTASFTTAVERPHSSGLGGGGFFLYHEGSSHKIYALDFRERAPEKSKKDLYLDQNGNYISELSKQGGLSTAVPGFVLGMWEIHKKFGKLPWKKVIEPAIELSEKGFAVYEALALALKNKQSSLSKNPAARSIFLKPNGEPLVLGDLLIQKDLAHTLKGISKNGAEDFYKGSLAKKISQAIQADKGILTLKDLHTYKVKWRQPVQGHFLNYTIYSFPPPSSGGIHVLQFLKMLENEKFSARDLNQSSTIHLKTAILQSAFADRAQYLGDPDFVKIPQKELLSPNYLNQRRKEIPKDRARHAQEVFAGEFSNLKESTETTHLSLMDDQGNAISSTQTINGWMGSSLVVPDTGILMNNEMDDFSAKSGTSNLYGAIGGDANEIAPYKTPLSSMSPTLVLDQKQVPIMSVGAPGGTRIISCTAQTLYNYLYFKMPLWESITNIRLHHQWQPDILTIEKPGPKESEINNLKKMGYQLELANVPCRVMGVAKEKEFTAVADPRDIGTSLAH